MQSEVEDDVSEALERLSFLGRHDNRTLAGPEQAYLPSRLPFLALSL